MAFTTSDASKKWISWLTFKRFRSQADIANSRRRAGNPSSIPFDKKGINLRVEFDNAEDDDAQSSPISVVNLNVVTMKHPSTTVDIPVRPPTPTSTPTTEQDFQRAISEAQRYKDACTAAEEAADKEAQRRFKHYQDMYYVEKAIQRKSAEARTKLERLTRRAKEAGFQVERVSLSKTRLGTATKDGEYFCDNRPSQDSIDGFIARLGVTDWRL